ncbi:hypothetical protein SSYRP_v1c06730 [Spiroplasma syrphidicola EA-1]|uniref:Cell division protein SepF n=1 Tax=Spiroplasma syrphidicola EA-1 TaxID=1276229 RepID=R4U6M0_9MOLU|nr:cell division protein SepF [Spiroplasma syrphidicola]AGM26263.1 hypothetical protein SSYRP_v1c06730 [Spiroplasma syrphidicola EA-1]
MGIFSKKKSNNLDFSQQKIDFSEQTSSVDHQQHEGTNPSLNAEPLQKVSFTQPVINPEQASLVSAKDDSTDQSATTGYTAKDFNDAPKIADLLLKHGQIIVHLEHLPKEERIRLLDFISGVMYSFAGTARRLENQTYEFVLGD